MARYSLRVISHRATNNPFPHSDETIAAPVVLGGSAITEPSLPSFEYSAKLHFPKSKVLAPRQACGIVRAFSPGIVLSKGAGENGFAALRVHLVID